MNDFPRLVDGAGNDPAAILLRSARADKTSEASKERMRAMLGLVDPADKHHGHPYRVPALPKPVVDERAKRSRKIARFIPFRHLLSSPKPAVTRKVAPVVVAFVQVAAMIAALFVRPLPRIEPAPSKAQSRGDEPEVSFFVPKAKPRQSARAQANAAEGPAKPATARKEAAGLASQSRPVQPREPVPPKESIVGDEHAGALAENDLQPAVPAAIAPEPVGNSAVPANSPMIFQAGMTQPVRISGIDPSYPQIARMRGVKGTVIMRCLVTEEGLARNCSIIKSPAYLGEAVLSASRTWRLTPVTWQGSAVPVYYIFRYNFKLG